MRKSLKHFSPDKVAVLEAHTWYAYYKHQFLKLFFLLAHLMREFYGFSYVRSIQAAYYTTFAVIDFRLNKGKESQDVMLRITRKLTQFYRMVSSQSIMPFDYSKAAELELAWWLIDRYPSRYDISREEAIKLPIALMYDIDPSKLTEYADNRARAMVLQDEAEIEHREADWKKIESLLKLSYSSLYTAIQ